MKYLAAYMLCQLGGNKKPTADDLTKILSSVGIEADQERLRLVLDKLKDVNADDAIEQGRAKLASVPSGGGGGGGAAHAAAAAPATAGGGGADKGGKAAAAAPAKKEEKEEEKEEEEDMGFGLFD